jgi:cytochrome c
MKRGVAFVAAMLTVTAWVGAFASSARAADAPRGQIVANSNACMGCHAVDRKLVGPSFQQIAAKYKGAPAYGA